MRERRHVRIVAKDHPHYPETGYLSGHVIRLVTGKELAMMVLDSCRHRAEACYVGKGDVGTLDEPTPRTRGRKVKG